MDGHKNKEIWKQLTVNESYFTPLEKKTLPKWKLNLKHTVEVCFGFNTV